MVNYSTRSTILVVDDQPTNIRVLGEALKNDYQIKMAISGEKAIEIAASEDQPDLILLDIIMPGIDGYEVCKRLKNNHRTEKIPIIFITAKNQEEDETKGLDYGAVDYITKPFSLPIVKARVKTHLELKKHRDILEDLSTLDGLTGIPNRRKFDDYLNIEWKRAVRDSYPLSLIMIDIDYFKLFNDNYGHGTGDECLKKVANDLSMTARRPADFVARYGGEEFASVLPNTTIENAIEFAELLRLNIEKLNIPHDFSPTYNKVTISLGCASTTPTIKKSYDLLIRSADNALYKAKSDGRNKSKWIDI
ncbi:MAG: PleD family two-component system response regulator [Desulfobacteraceae bacterium]|nr:PleD family two-component system response regulator [Desulfobacteraceae bacterium]